MGLLKHLRSFWEDEMVDELLIEDLSVAPGHRWAEIIARYNAVTDYLALDKPATSDVDEYGSRFGLSRRMFYRLINDRKRRMVDVTPPDVRKGHGRCISEAQEAVIAEALDIFGPGAWTRDVYAKALQISVERGVTSPSDYAVTSRIREAQDGTWIDKRLSHNFNWVIDICPLALNVINADSTIGPVHLAALIDLPSGQMLAFKVSVGPPDPLDMANLFNDARARFASIPDHRRKIASTAASGTQMKVIASLLAYNDIVTTPCDPKTLRSGEALMILFGRKI